MCGIAGFTGNKSFQNYIIKSTLKLMENRGPDNQAYFKTRITKKKNIYLLNSRLSIIDLDKRSNQPFVIDNLVMTYNGEIYNYLELKNRISKKVKFRTNSDTEVILQYYKLYGEKCFEFFEGMWSIAIYDKNQKKLIISRDRFGEKPLYYYQSKDGFYFASEIKFIKKLAHKKKFLINYKKIKDYLHFGHRAPYLDNKTFFEKIHKLDPGSYIKIDKNIKITKHRYWKISKAKEFKKNFEDVLKESHKIFDNTLKMQLRSDVPIALLLSGGIDSSLLATKISKYYKKKLSTFSIYDSKDKTYDERDNINIILRKLKIKKNVKIDFVNEFSLNRLKKAISYQDAPLLTITDFAKNILAEKISKTENKVVITGNGADEFFSGYFHHHLQYLLDIKRDKNTKLFKNYYKNWRLNILPQVRNEIFKNLQKFKLQKRKYIYDDYMSLNNFFLKPSKPKLKFKKNNSSLLKDSLLKEIFIEHVPHYTVSDDANFMQFSLENRSPYLCKNMFEFLQNVPTKFFLHNGYSKYILRRILNRKLPNNIVWDPIKRGFNFSIFKLINLKSKKFRKFIDKKSNIYKIISKRNFIEFLNENKKKEINLNSKFLFRFISVKIFLELNS